MIVDVGDLVWCNPDGTPRIMTVTWLDTDDVHAYVYDGNAEHRVSLSALIPSPSFVQNYGYKPRRKRRTLSPDTITVLYWAMWWALGGALASANIYYHDRKFWLIFAIVTAIEYLNKKR